jgi:molybdate transport system regulatory protein
MRLLYKLWLDYRGRAFGDGPARLLDGVERSGSLRKAAQDLGMSYNKAWRILHAAEERLGFALLDRSVGGSLGGGSQLTPEGKDLLRRYRALAEEAAQVLQDVFARHFGDWRDPGEGTEVSAGKEEGETPQTLAGDAGTPPRP